MSRIQTLPPHRPLLLQTALSRQGPLAVVQPIADLIECVETHRNEPIVIGKANKKKLVRAKVTAILVALECILAAEAAVGIQHNLCTCN